MFESVNVGDFVTRILGGMPMQIRVTEITDTEVLCGARDIGWKFDKATGAEIDEELGWGPRGTGSYIVPNPETPGNSDTTPPLPQV